MAAKKKASKAKKKAPAKKALPRRRSSFEPSFCSQREVLVACSVSVRTQARLEPPGLYGKRPFGASSKGFFACHANSSECDGRRRPRRVGPLPPPAAVAAWSVDGRLDLARLRRPISRTAAGMPWLPVVSRRGTSLPTRARRLRSSSRSAATAGAADRRSRHDAGVVIGLQSRVGGRRSGASSRSRRSVASTDGQRSVCSTLPQFWPARLGLGRSCARATRGRAARVRAGLATSGCASTAAGFAALVLRRDCRRHSPRSRQRRPGSWSASRRSDRLPRAARRRPRATLATGPFDVHETLDISDAATPGWERSPDRVHRWLVQAIWSAISWRGSSDEDGRRIAAREKSRADPTLLYGTD